MKRPVRERYRYDGYRYVREYRVQCGSVKRWALWEVQDGRARRVGTAWHYQQVEVFLGLKPDFVTRSLN